MADITLNVTDAVLQGTLQDPAYSGNVDGSTFTGDISYADTTTPPPDTSGGGGGKPDKPPGKPDKPPKP